MAVREWDAATYHRVSVPHEEWAAALMERLPLVGGETVLDAGCGTGRVTRMLILRLPAGRVIAVDGSAAMVGKVGEVLRPQDEAFVADLLALEVKEPVDAVVSSAVFHWIEDHDELFRRLRAALKPGGRLVAQCGGEGNVDSFRRARRAVAAREPYAPHFVGFDEPGRTAGAAETEERLRSAGFDEVRCWLEPWPVIPPEPIEFARLMLGAHLERLPENLRGPFVVDTVAAAGEPLTLDYVRLNIEARAAAGGPDRTGG
jgi:trans-aconitate 2-methyltransferase